jgi:hypothetical protein
MAFSLALQPSANDGPQKRPLLSAKGVWIKNVQLQLTGALDVVDQGFFIGRSVKTTSAFASALPSSNTLLQIFGASMVTQRVFNGFLNEWDICTEFNPHETSDNDLLDWNDETETDAFGTSPAHLPSRDGTITLDLSTDVPVADYTSNLEGVFPDALDVPPDDFPIDSFGDYLYSCFGLEEEHPATSINAKEFERVCRVFGYYGGGFSNLEWAMEAPAHNLLNYLLTEQTPIPPRDHGSMAEIILQSQVAASRTRDEHDKVCYVLSGKGDDHPLPWVLMVTDPVTILHCLRQSPASRTPDIARYLL